MLKARPYQARIHSATLNFMLSNDIRGQIYAPTGSGKTEQFMMLLANEFAKGKKLNILIIYPRIALIQDQLSRFKASLKTPIMCTSFHSGAHVNGDEEILEISTTDVGELSRIIHNTPKTHITFCSYKSAHKLSTIKFDLIICDEAHTLTQNDLTPTLIGLNASKILFYTATPITKDLVDDESTGMNNPELFGSLIASVTPSELIKNGYIVAPMLHWMSAAVDRSGLKVSPHETIAICFNAQKVDICRNGMPYHQMLVACRGSADIELINSIEGLSLIKSKCGNVNVYTVMSDACTKNGNAYAGTRFQMLDEIKSSKADCILVHYDTLSEGIDISTLTGLLVMRQLSQYKFLQTVGRTGRPYIGDMHNGECIDINNRMKPYSIITLPIIENTQLAGNQAKIYCGAFALGGYGELSTYVVDEIREQFTKKDNDFDLGADDEELPSSHIVDHSIRRDLENLIALGFASI